MEKQKNGELSRMFGYAGKFHVLTVLGCVLSGISTILSMLPFVCIWLVIRDLIQAFAAGDISLATGSAHYAWMAVVFAAASILIYFIALNCTHLAAFRTATNMRKSAIHHIVTLPLGYFSQNASGRLRNIIDDNAGLTEGFLAHQLPDLTGAAVMPVAVIILIFLFDWRLGICCLIPMGISVIFLKQMMGGDNAQFMGKYMTALETMNKEAVEYIRGIQVVKTFTESTNAYRKLNDDIKEYRKFANEVNVQYQPTYVGFLTILSSALLFIIPVAVWLLVGSASYATFVPVLLMFLFFGVAVFFPVLKLLWIGSFLNQNNMGVQKIDDILYMDEIEEPDIPRHPKDASVEFRNVSFAYDTTPILKAISFISHPGTITALVGPSGAGKSTVAMLAARFWDVQSGEILIGGVPVKEIPTSVLMDNVAFVFQDNMLFFDTIEENTRMGNKTATFEEVARAACAAQCHEFIESLPNGYQTLVGEGGIYLSGGEAQRIALARAILKDSPIILLDEATAFADPENEGKILAAFSHLIKGKTVLVIAHRLSTITNADRILYVDKGVIAEQGTHEQLLALKGEYARMWETYNRAKRWTIGGKNNRKL